MEGLDLKNVLKTTYQSKNKADTYFNSHDYYREKEFSNISNRAYVNPNKKEVVLTYRGTKNLINDVPADLDILLGTRDLFGTRQREARKLYNNIKEKFPEHKIKITGNSLGGFLASNVSNDKTDTIKTHNKGQGLYNFIETPKTNEIHYRNPIDLISVVGSLKTNVQNVGNIELNPLYAHSISSLPNKPIEF